MVGMFAIVALTMMTPVQITDLRATQTLTLGSGIAWHFTVPAVNDSSCIPDADGEVVCSLPHRYAPATDTIKYHWVVRGLPPPYLQVIEDSAWVARGERVSRFYQDWRTAWHLGALTTHWFSREAVWPMSAHHVESVRINRMQAVRDW